MSAPRDRPWLMRTYAGHSSARASNELFREGLARGQTGLSIAFDLPTQTGYDPDEPLARGEVGKVGVPISHLGDLDVLLGGLDLEAMNTSMTINATAPWLLALYVALADRRGASRSALSGTVQNDLVKEFLSRGTWMVPPAPSLRLQADTIAFSVAELPRFNPINVCSYHLQEAGATPVLEVSFALANARLLLDTLGERDDVDEEAFARAAGRISFFVNAGLRFVEEMVKLRVMGGLWDRLLAEDYGITDPRLRRFRYGVQVNSLGLTEQQPENNSHRIAIELLGVVLSKRARARAVQLPAWNEALGLPRPWDQQWSMRLQQVLAYETDLLEYGDLFDGSSEIERLEGELGAAVAAELRAIDEEGGVLEALASGAMKEKLVAAQAERLRRIEAGEQVVIGVNRFTEALPSPLTSGEDPGILEVDAEAERDQIERVSAWREARAAEEVEAALMALRDAAASGANILPASIRCAEAGVTTGEWGRCLRDLFGGFRAPTGVGIPAAPMGDSEAARAEVERVSALLGERLRLLVGKPGLDGHSNGAEQVAVRARDAGMDVIYEGIRLTPEQIARSAQEEGVHAVGLSILSGSHRTLVPDVLDRLRARGLGDLPVIVGGIVPPGDREALRALGVARIFTPSDYDLDRVMVEIARAVAEGKQAARPVA